MNSTALIPVSTNRIVSLRYILFNGRGEELENSMTGAPVTYLHGSGVILPVLQAQLEGLTAGSRKTVLMGKDTGLTEEDFSFEVLIEDVREASEEELLLGYAVLPANPPCGADCDCFKS